METIDVDFIVIGAGSAGCVLADRLSAQRRNRVLVLEAGGSDWNPLIRLPTGEVFTVGSSLDWRFKSAPEPGLGGIHVDLPRGKVVGGSSSINGQLYVRGHPLDYDDWERAGCSGWSFSDVLEFFKMSENWKGPAGPMRGQAGPLKTAFGRYRNPLFDAFLQAGQEAGFAANADLNGEIQDGFGRSQYTHEHWFPLRCSAAHAYLSRAKRRSNTTLLTHAYAERLVFDGRICRGVEFTHAGRRKRARAEHEVILAAGTYQSPQLLMLSGIGPSTELRGHGIDVVASLPGVGNNLRDHFGPLVQCRALKPVTYYALRNPARLALAVAELIFLRRGPLAVFPMDAQAFVRSRSDLDRPDLQFYLLPMAIDREAENPFKPTFHGFSIHWCVLRPASVGRVKLRSSDPRDPPLIQHNYYAEESDRRLNRWGLRFARRLLAQPAFDHLRGEETYPGSDSTSDEQIDDFARSASSSHYHPVGTCQMGTHADAVVDPRLRVHGIDRLRVVDASIMPQLVGGNTNAPTIMIAEKGAHMILEDMN